MKHRFVTLLCVSCDSLLSSLWWLQLMRYVWVTMLTRRMNIMHHITNNNRGPLATSTSSKQELSIYMVTPYIK